jgi:ankyrin repeat protein
MAAASIVSQGPSPDELVRRLLDEDADIEASDSHGNTALHEAARAQNLSTIVLLLSAGADPDAETRRDALPSRLPAERDTASRITHV